MSTSGRIRDGFSGAKVSGSNGKVYLLQRIIGRGHFATVYRCIDRERTKYACKVIASKDLSSDREFQILKSVRHENILFLHEVLFAEDHFFIILPFMGGGELFEKISASKYFSEKEARRVLTQIARGIEYLHSVGICHRDLKPENILCTEEPENYRVVISDFGLSKLFGRGEMMQTSCGTLHYAAPEIFSHHPYTNACDIWSFGVIAYILLTGCFPFDNRNRSMIPSLIASASYNKANLEIRRVSKPACDFIERILKVNPAERPTATQLLSDPWMVGTGIEDVDLTASAGNLSSLQGSSDFEDDMDDDPM